MYCIVWPKSPLRFSLAPKKMIHFKLFLHPWKEFTFFNHAFPQNFHDDFQQTKKNSPSEFAENTMSIEYTSCALGKLSVQTNPMYYSSFYPVENPCLVTYNLCHDYYLYTQKKEFVPSTPLGCIHPYPGTDLYSFKCYGTTYAVDSNGKRIMSSRPVDVSNDVRKYISI